MLDNCIATGKKKNVFPWAFDIVLYSNHFALLSSCYKLTPFDVTAIYCIKTC